MTSSTWLSILMIALGVILLLSGKRLWLVGAGVGALLGAGLVGLMPDLLGGTLGYLVIIGLAVALGVMAIMFKGFTNLIAFGIGFMAGGAIILSILNMFSFNNGLLTVVFVLVFGLIGALLARKFTTLVILVIGALIGALLITGAISMFVEGASGAPLPEALSSFLVVVLSGFGVWFQARNVKKAEASTAKS